MPEADQLSRVLSGIDQVLNGRRSMIVRVVPGFGFAEAQRAKIRESCARAEVIGPAADLAAMFASSDVAVVNGSITAYEAAAVGLPLVMVPMDPNQRDTVHRFEAAGACLAVPPIEKLEPARLADTVEKLLTDRTLLMELSERVQRLVDGRGGERIVSETAELCGRESHQGYTATPSPNGFFRAVAQ
jgi:spore coat polysaccharide biosynthesis protein SpsF